MTSRPHVLLTAALVVLAGCAGGIGTREAGPTPGAATPGTAAGPDADGGTVRLYVSDERNAIDDFARLNVTVTRVGFMLVDAAGNASTPGANGSTPSEDATATPVPTVTATPVSNATPTTAPNASAAPVSNATSTTAPNATETVADGGGEEGDGGDEGDGEESDGEEGDGEESDDGEEGDGEESDDGEEGDGEESDDGEEGDGEESDDGEEGDGEEGDGEEGDGEEGDGRGDGRWVVRDVPDTTVDLTRLRGANASLLGSFDVPSGEYAKVFLYVGGVEGVLDSGEEVRVHLPSERLHVTKRFTVGNGEPVNFVFDVSVVEAGNSGKYVLKPVVSESGAGKPVEPTDGSPGDRADLEARFVGPVKPGDEATLRVTRRGTPVSNATVRVNGTVVGHTGDDGTYDVAVPEGADVVEATVVAGDEEVTVEREFGSG